MFTYYSIIYERNIGTVRYLFFFIVSSTMAETIFALSMFLLHFLFPFIIKAETYGLLPLIMTMIVIECDKNPEELKP